MPNGKFRLDYRDNRSSANSKNPIVVLEQSVDCLTD